MSTRLEIADLHIVNDLGVEVVSGMCLSVAAGGVTALVGESGSGKTVTALSVLGLLPPGLRKVAGRIVIDGRTCGDVELARCRGRDVAMVFQEPMTALNPVMRIGDQLLEARRHRASHSGAQRRAWCEAALGGVGIDHPSRVRRAFPHELSGGMRQRVLIAMALAAEPGVVLADEPTTALDAVNRAGVLDLLVSRARQGAAVLLVTHDLGSVSRWATDVVVMCDGRLLEAGPAVEVLAGPRHPYTRGLLACTPDARGSGRLIELESALAGGALDTLIDTALGPQLPWWQGRSGRWALAEVGVNHRVACRLKEP